MPCAPQSRYTPLATQGGFDLIWDGGPVARYERPTSLPSLLGCFNPHDKNQLRQSAAAWDEEDDAGGGLPARKSGSIKGTRR